MEYSQTKIRVWKNVKPGGLNPYSNGILTDSSHLMSVGEAAKVLILILMEYSQTQDQSCSHLCADGVLILILMEYSQT